MSRLTYRYTIPESLRPEPPVTQVTMRPLSSREEIDASRVGNYDYTKTQYEATKRAICELDGRKVTIADGEIDRFWEAAGPKLRTLLLKAFGRVSSPSTEEDQDFLKSEEVRVE